MIQTTLDSLRRLWYAEMLICAAMFVLAASPRQWERYITALHLVDVMPRVGTDPLYYEGVINGHNEFVARHAAEARQKFLSKLPTLSKGETHFDTNSLVGLVNIAYDPSKHTIVIRDNPRLSEIVEVLRRLDIMSYAADPNALLDALRKAVPPDCIPCSVGGVAVGTKDESVVPVMNFRYPSGDFKQIDLPGVPEHEVLRTARLSARYRLLTRISERFSQPPVDPDFILTLVRGQSPPHVQDVWLEIKDMTMQEASEYVRRREVETRARLSLIGLTLPQEIAGFGAPGILLIFQVYLYFLIDHITNLWRSSPDVHRDAEILMGYPWPPLFTGFKGSISVSCSLVILPLLASAMLFKRLTPTNQPLAMWLSGEGAIKYGAQAALIFLVFAGALLVVWRIRELRAQVHKDTQRRGIRPGGYACHGVEREWPGS